MEGLGAKEMEALAELLCPDTADSGDLDGASPIPRPQASSGKYRSNAKPNVKIGRKEELDIWKLDELNQGATFRQLKDHRTEPEHEVLFSQSVSPEDVYLGLSDRDPTTDHCETLLVKTLEDRVVVDSPLHKLNLALPYSAAHPAKNRVCTDLGKPPAFSAMYLTSWLATSP
ncbi:sarcoma antigen [Cyclospora cayetanensis]|uniref:Sarcoma antigen n=1 Tax=Cyclospora cayetanensis TaxID=88456 RepID=A0A1D3D209_9EIME|nr:sarcoma antigen [Cyclospora cayetanensis]